MSGINPLTFFFLSMYSVCVGGGGGGGNVSLPGLEPTTHSFWKVHRCDLFHFIRLGGNFSQ